MEITTKELQEKLNNNEKVIVEFWAAWCGPCKMMKPVFERVAESNDTDVQMYTMDIEENKEFAMSLGIKSIPTVKVFNGNDAVETHVGVLQETHIKQLVKNLLLN